MLTKNQTARLSKVQGGRKEKWRKGECCRNCFSHSMDFLLSEKDRGEMPKAVTVQNAWSLVDYRLFLHLRQLKAFH